MEGIRAPQSPFARRSSDSAVVVCGVSLFEKNPPLRLAASGAGSAPRPQMAAMDAPSPLPALDRIWTCAEGSHQFCCKPEYPAALERSEQPWTCYGFLLRGTLRAVDAGALIIRAARSISLWYRASGPELAHHPGQQSTGTN